jgi:cell wall-associated NlpC family hydrolase
LKRSTKFEFSHANRWQGYPGWVPQRRRDTSPVGFSFRGRGDVAVRADVAETRKGRGARMDVPMGSRLAVIYTQKDWARVQGPSGEMGWMRLNDLRMDRDAPKTSEDVRAAFLTAARQFLGDRYYWGGRSGHRKKGLVPSGVDCSGLVNVSFRAVGVNAPRDAFELHTVGAAGGKRGGPSSRGFGVLSEKIRAGPDRSRHDLRENRNGDRSVS